MVDRIQIIWYLTICVLTSMLIVYLMSFTEHPFLNEEEVMINSVWGSESVVLVVNILTKRISRLNTLRSSAVGLACTRDSILVHQNSYYDVDTSFNCLNYSPHELVLYVRESNGEISEDQAWPVGGNLLSHDGINNEKHIRRPTVCKTIIDEEEMCSDGIRFEVLLIHSLKRLNVNDYDPDDESLSSPELDGLPNMVSKDGKIHPLILIPHGGPHSSYTSSYNYMYDVMAQEGCVVVLVNYRGSIGYGDKPLLNLPGKIGQQDVEDCMAALDLVLDRLASVRPFQYLNQLLGFQMF